MQTSYGIDAHGHRKGLHVAEVTWAPFLDGPHHVRFLHIPVKVSACPAVDPEGMRCLVARGEVEALARATMPIVDCLEPLLGRVVPNMSMHLVAIDCPSGFARNKLGHGRRTEKSQKRYGFGAGTPIHAQMTPSLECGKPHGGAWPSWLVYGMAAFALLGGRLLDGPLEDCWRTYLAEGPDGTEPLEAFPSATIQFLRQPRNAVAKATVSRILGGMIVQEAPDIIRLVLAALDRGPSALNGDDRAAALVASLSTLAAVFPDSFSQVEMDDPQVRKHAASGVGREGCITLVEGTGHSNAVDPSPSKVLPPRSTSGSLLSATTRCQRQSERENR